MPISGNGTAKVDRRLVAILAADIAGYSALMGSDEARTVRDLKAHQAVVLPMIVEFGGRIIDTAGDGILAEFASVVNALECAIAIQTKMSERNAACELKRRMQFRIGVNIGDVIYDESRNYGDGINIAARLEAIADPGGIFISRQAGGGIRGRWNRRIGRGAGPRAGQADTGDQTLPGSRWRASRLCDRWQRADAGESGELDEPS